ncbi:MAG: hypothetical protein KJ645_10150 [Planctomycetes bacterium]|nr:hypothetical protein [Planctomycetota bacterium]
MNKQDFIQVIKKTQAPLKKMVEMIPDDKLDWAPGEGFMTMGQVLKHLSENWCLIKMMVTNEWPFSDMAEMADAMKLENMPGCNKAEALVAFDKDLKDAVAFIEKELSEDEFFNKVVEAPWGFKGEIWKALLMAKEHQTNHKMQLHLYLKLLGQPVNTETLYGMG